MIWKTPDPKAHQLGWARVVVRQFAGHPDGPPAGRQELITRVEAWAERHQGRWLNSETGKLTSGSGSSALRIAEDLRLILDAQLTDLGRSLAHLDKVPHDDSSSPFQHPVELRWLLWWAVASSEPDFWAAALRAWNPDAGRPAWLVATARLLASEGDPALLQWTEGKSSGRVGSLQAKPRLGQLEVLGWSSVLPDLHRWVGQRSSFAAHEDIFAAFCVAERLQPVSPEPDRLRRTLLNLPPSLLGLVEEAPREAVLLLTVASSLSDGSVEDWFGPGGAAALQLAREKGVRLKSGGDALHENLTWDAGALLIPWGQASPPGADAPDAVESPPPDPASASSEGPTAPPHAPPPTPAPAWDDKQRRALAWLRAVAWWCRGPTPADLLLSGHGSPALAVHVLEHWFRPDQKHFWERRSASTIAVNTEVKHEGLQRWLSVIADRWAGMPKLLSEAVEKKAPFDILVGASVTLPDPQTALSPHPSIRDWLGAAPAATDPTRRWEEVEDATRFWLAALVEAGHTDRRDILDLLANETDDPVDGAQRVLVTLSNPPVAVPIVEGRVMIVGDLLSLQLPESIDSLEFSLVEAPDAPALIVTCTRCDVVGAPRVLVADLFRQAVNTLTRWGLENGRRLTVVPLPETGQAFDQDNALLVHPWRQTPMAAGVGFWGTSDWFVSPVPLPPSSVAGRRVRDHDREPRALDRLVGRWVEVEHLVEGGDQGEKVIASITKAAVAMSFAWVQRDIHAMTQLASGAPCPWLDRRKACLASNKPSDLIRSRLTHASWILAATYALRNRVVHEADRGDAAHEIMLEELDRSLSVLLDATLSARGAHSWERLHALLYAICSGNEAPAVWMSRWGI